MSKSAYATMRRLWRDATRNFRFLRHYVLDKSPSIVELMTVINVIILVRYWYYCTFGCNFILVTWGSFTLRDEIM